MSPAGKLHMIMELFNKGFLCNCNEIAVQTIPEHEYFDDELEEMIVHRDDCQGKEKIKELLNE